MQFTPGPADYLRDEYDKSIKRRSKVPTVGKALRISTAALDGPSPTQYTNEVNDILSGHRSSPRHSISRQKRDLNHPKASVSPGPGTYEHKR